ncbi:MAG: hypothetical protein ACXVHY_10255 [Methanobacterium sp.]
MDFQLKNIILIIVGVIGLYSAFFSKHYYIVFIILIGAGLFLLLSGIYNLYRYYKMQKKLKT